jgi:serine/threonine-protein kinase
MTLRGASLMVLKLAFIAATSGLILLLTFYLSVRSMIFGNEVQVPDLRGETVEDARALLSGADLAVEVVEERFDPAVPAGQVVSQTPAPGSSIKTKRKVRVILSRGTEVLQVPDLDGQTERRALLEIDRLGLRVGEVARVSAAGQPLDRIIAQDPVPATDIFRGEAVSLLVSRGPRDPVYVMPDLAGQPLERVKRVLGGRGLRVAQTRFQFSSAPDGTIIRQFPKAGYPVSRRDAITVVVSRSPLV